MIHCCLYLRKSRADEEIENKFGEGETLKKHRTMLLKLAKEQNLNIGKIFEEIVSGESLIHRPEMLNMLKEIETNLWDAVLCIDIDRLGRGNMQEQGLILETLKKSKTKIITLRKTYDLNDDFDEEYSEFEAFMSRKELKLINRRLQRGRIRSIEDGNYIGTVPPYGYLKENGTLIPHPEQADVVRLIFYMYLNKNLGAGSIAEELNRMGYKSYTNIDWKLSSVSTIISNIIYAGKIAWQKIKTVKSIKPNQKKETSRREKSDWIICDGRHQALVTLEEFERAQKIKKSRVIAPTQINKPLVNPLAGLVFCKVCGSKMRRRPYTNQKAHLDCPVKCGNKSTRFEFVENNILIQLEDIVKNFELNISIDEAPAEKNNEIFVKNIKNLELELHNLKKQKLKLHDLLEQGVYDIETFLSRSNNISERIISIEENIIHLKNKIEEESEVKNMNISIQNIKNTLVIYPMCSPEEKNKLLKSILVKIEYYKDKSQKNNDFHLTLFPII